MEEVDNTHLWNSGEFWGQYTYSPSHTLPCLQLQQER